MLLNFSTIASRGQQLKALSVEQFLSNKELPKAVMKFSKLWSLLNCTLAHKD
jgi:hypothetical protein